MATIFPRSASFGGPPGAFHLSERSSEMSLHLQECRTVLSPIGVPLPGQVLHPVDQIG